MLPNTSSRIGDEYEEMGIEELMDLNYDITNDENQSNEDQESTQSIESEEFLVEKSDKIVLKIKRGFASHSFCFICKRKTGSKPMTVIPFEAILEIFLKRNMLIPKGARSCRVHLTESNYVKDEFIDKIPLADNSISSNNLVQRKLFSGHIKRPLIKPFVITSSNGRIINVYGDNSATDNDAFIMGKVLQNDKDLRNLLKRGDLAIFDPGFKECIARLKAVYGLNCKIPTFLKDGQKQLSWSEANETRLITKCKFVIEVINGIFKQQFKSLKETQNTMLSHICDDYKIAVTLINAFFSERISDKEDENQISVEMKSKLRIKNNLEKYLDLGFPKLDVEIIKKKITFGRYQLEQAYGYLAEHFESNEEYKFLACENLITENAKKIIFVTIQSRHSNSVKHKVFVMFKPLSKSLNDVSWVCSCKMGKRTLGCYSHVAALVYFMGVGIYDIASIPKPGYRLKNILVPILNDSDEEGDIRQLILKLQ
ncbi:vacuolar sorting-associated 13c [Brachionus plicatilis]|uniref:Vacuolar sorting-associated 13c n=1 Tax=Brachionus plicatilis TaxID=10195 RepID=A0A3M7Q960_BRAPC|nr:vacuolar sorting-associated 13c [Brachionus plicatilis]